MLQGLHCSYVTVHRNETYLYFNELSEDAERPGRRAPCTEQKRIEAASARCRSRRARVRVSSFWWSKSPDRTASELLVRLASVRFRGPRDQRSTDARSRQRPHHFGKATNSVRQNGCVLRPQLVQPRGDALRFPVFAVSLAFLAASTALDTGVTPNYQIQLDSLR